MPRWYFISSEQNKMQNAKLSYLAKNSILATGMECKFLASWRSQAQEKWWKFFVKIFNVVQKRANKKLLLYLYLFFQLMSQQSDALNSLILNVFTNSKAFSLSVIPSIGTFGFFFQQTSGKLIYLFGCSSHSVYFFVKKTFLSFPEKLSICAYFGPM